MIYALTIFTSAFLLFQIQLIAAKQLLPWYGGSPAVWTTCQLFFQVVLLGGYAYAHLSGRALGAKSQGRIHVALLFATAVALGILGIWGGVPLLAPAALKPTGSEPPIPLLLLTLLASVGLPFLTLATTSPLLQRWHSRSSETLASTYRLYALSNVGSLLGLILYPLAIERLMGLPQQAWCWTLLFAVFAAGCGILAWRFSSSDTGTSASNPAETALDQGTGASSDVGRAWRSWFWVLLAFIGSAMSLSTTNQLCQEVAVVPFLWALPLAIYLLTFIISFDHPRWYSRRWFVLAAALLSLVILPNSVSPFLSVSRQVLAYSLFLFCFCMVCHGELMRLRPGASRLTFYYLLIATGGALGGILVGLVAPLLFSGVWEFQLTIMFGWIVFLGVLLCDRTSPLHTGDRLYFGLLVALLGVVGFPFLAPLVFLTRIPWIFYHARLASFGSGIILTLLICTAFWRSPFMRRRIWPWSLIGLVLALSLVFLGQRIAEFHSDSALCARNFFGIVRVVPVRNHFSEVIAYELIHGVTKHGIQLTEPRFASVPMTYYSPSSGVGLAARYLTEHAETNVPNASDGINIGVLGLGVGTIATYARSNDQVVFYEIDPIVIGASRGPHPFFTFVRDCPGRVTITPGDARLCLERELAAGHPQRFDLLAVDAFSGDAIPVHLLTEEAFRLYAAHLRDDAAIIAVNVSNRYLQLEPVLAANARALGFSGVALESAGDKPQPEPSTWILLSRNARMFDRLAFASARPLCAETVHFTDQYSNLFRVLK